LGTSALMSALKKTRQETGSKVRKRMKEFRANNDWFSELCFCILTANYTAEGGIKIQNSVDDFSKLPRARIEKVLRLHGYRFPKVRSEFIHLAKKHKENLGSLSSMDSSTQRREWLVGNIKGLGYKESSHFLRNVGFFDVAIIDRHILFVLHKHNLIEMPKTMTKKRYLEIECILDKIAKEASMSLGELDLYLWHMKTGKILK